MNPFTWARFRNPGSIFDGMNCWIISINGDTATVQFSDDAPNRSIPLSCLSPIS